MPLRKKKKVTMELRLAQLGPNFKKQEEPACACCGYEADYILKIESLERYFCERDLINALLDAVNFNCVAPAGLAA